MKLLITGIAGFIGSHLAIAAAKEGYEVVGVDNFNEYYDPTLKRRRVDRFNDSVTVLEGDITDETFIKKIFGEHSIDVVCHLAAQAGVRYSIDHPDVYVATNIMGTQIILEAMRVYNVPRMIFASTSSVYGTSIDMPFKENNSADTPMSVYAATKRSCELMAHAYHNIHGIETTCLRFFTVYGPWGRPDMALFKFTESMQKGEPIDIYNNGDMRRDFTYVDDIVRGFLSAVERQLGYTIINLGHGAPVGLLDFVHVLESELGIKAKKNMMPMQPGDVKETYADVSKAKELLNFKAKVGVEEGVRNFVTWYKEYKGN